MKKKNILLVAPFFFFFFLFTQSVSASSTCRYSKIFDTNENKTYSYDIIFDDSGLPTSILLVNSDDPENPTDITGSYDVMFSANCPPFMEIKGSGSQYSRPQMVEGSEDSDGSYTLDTSYNPHSEVFNDSNRADFLEKSYVSCGGSGSLALIKHIPAIIPRISNSLYNIAMVIVPVIMILFGMIDLIKGIISQKEDEMRKGRSSLVKRLIMGTITFLVVLLVKMLINLVGGRGNSMRIVACVDCFVNNKCSQSSSSTEDPKIGTGQAVTDE